MIQAKFPIGGHARQPVMQFYSDGREERSILRLFPHPDVSVKIPFTAEQSRLLRVLVDARRLDEKTDSLRAGRRSYREIAEGYRTRAGYHTTTEDAMARAKRRINRRIANGVRVVDDELHVPELFQSKRGEGVRLAPYIRVVEELDSPGTCPPT